jgi:mRNA interferase MazF
MNNYSKNDVILVQYPFSDLSAYRVRPGVIVSHPHVSSDYFIVPLTSKIRNLLPGEFPLKFWQKAGLNVPTAVKRGIYTINQTLIVKTIGKLEPSNSQQLQNSIKQWLGFLQP